MSNQDFSISFSVDRSANETFAGIVNVGGWWSEEVQGGTQNVGDEFTYHYKDIHRCKMRLTEVIPGKKMVWMVLENHFNFIADQSEWVGNKITFDLVEGDGKTQITFTQKGLIPAYECYDICQKAWTGYLQGSLVDLITLGKGQPNPKE